MKLLAQVPEQPIREDWTWLTDTIVSDNGTEQRINNRDIPKRLFSVALQFDDANDLRSHVAAMFIGAKTSFQAPLYQYGTRLKATAGIGAVTLSIVSRRTELRVGGACLVYDNDGYELHTVLALTDVSVTLTAGLARLFGTRASICPVSTVVAPNNSSVTFGIVDEDAKANLTLSEIDFVDPFVNPYNDVALNTLNGFPILEARPLGTEFPDQFDTGIQTTDEGGAVQIRTPWTHTQVILQRSFICERPFDRTGWDTWRKFADTVKGSWKPFYMPTYRADFGLAVAPVAGGTSLTFAGVSYHDDYFPYAPFKAVAIFYPGGVHYAAVTACAIVGGNSQVTFAPALPGGVGAVQRVTMLLKVRIADDKVSCEHYSLYSRIGLTLRTVDA